MDSRSHEYKYDRLNSQDTTDQDTEQGLHQDSTPRSWISGRLHYGILYTVLLLSLISNGFQWIKSNAVESEQETERSEFSMLPHNIPIEYTTYSDYWRTGNETLAEERWEALDNSPGMVALTKEYQEQHNLPAAHSFPWDDNKSVYFTKAFHDLHCLKYLRKTLVDFDSGAARDVEFEHIDHCLDALRQDIMCRADDTPMPIHKKAHSLGQGQVYQCRDWNKLIAWTQAPERNACYRLASDYKTIVHTLEEYQYCAEDSPYYPIMTAYFDKWGHKNVFGD